MFPEKRSNRGVQPKMCSRCLSISVLQYAFTVDYPVPCVLTSSNATKGAAFRNLTPHIFRCLFVTRLCRSSKSPQSRCSSLAYCYGTAHWNPGQRSPLETVALNVGQTTVERGGWNYTCTDSSTQTWVTAPVLRNVLA